MRQHNPACAGQTVVFGLAIAGDIGNVGDLDCATRQIHNLDLAVALHGSVNELGIGALNYAFGWSCKLDLAGCSSGRAINCSDFGYLSFLDVVKDVDVVVPTVDLERGGIRAGPH